MSDSIQLIDSTRSNHLIHNQTFTPRPRAVQRRRPRGPPRCEPRGKTEPAQRDRSRQEQVQPYAQGRQLRAVRRHEGARGKQTDEK